MFSYDAKIWRTIWTLVRHPGELTEAYSEGKRASFLGPVQLYFWLQTLCFVGFRVFFPLQSNEADTRARMILIMTLTFAVVLAIVGFYLKRKFAEFVIFSLHLNAFLLLLLFFEYSLVPLGAAALQHLHLLSEGLDVGPFLTRTALLVMVPYSVVALRRSFRDPLWVGAIKTVCLYYCFIAVDIQVDKIWPKR